MEDGRDGIRDGAAQRLHPGTASGAGFDVDPTFVGQTLYFIGQNSQLGPGIYKTDGTAAGTVRFFSPSPAGAQLKALTSVGSTLYFTVNDQLWKTDALSE